MSYIATGPAACLNCGALLQGSYCASCGQKAAPPNPTVHELVHELVEAFLHIDGKMIESARLLLTRPGRLTREYFAGRRVRYLSPLRLYLTFSLLFFAASVLWSSSPVLSEQDIQELGAEPQTGILAALPPEQVSELVQRVQHDWMPRAMFFLVPISALLVMAVTRSARRNLPQHLWFALHVHAAYFGIAALTAVLEHAGGRTWGNILSFARVLFIVTYSVVAFHTAYAGSWPLAIGRAVAVVSGYAALVLGVLIALVLTIAYTG